MESLRFLTNISDMTYPHNWFPQARKLKRKIIYHMGPTNSGKTHSAITSLINAKTGIYLAPLRLLAWEVQEKINTAREEEVCSLVTGQEKKEFENATHYSCTVEMCLTDRKFDCAVIDEIQLISDEFRGSAWTTALLGLQAEEIHLCGDERALELVYLICSRIGDTVIKRKYDRLSELIVEDEHIHSVSQLQKGDCVITFSKNKIFKIKELINNTNWYKEHKNHPDEADSDEKKKENNKVAIIYGSLPPETKKEMAVNFNENKDYYFLVATDAVNYFI